MRSANDPQPYLTLPYLTLLYFAEYSVGERECIVTIEIEVLRFGAEKGKSARTNLVPCRALLGMLGSLACLCTIVLYQVTTLH